ncbi:UDP-N-acetylmuramate dehydrogenase [Dyadobacter fanqingshengii]|uniref:UDP-N-acetylenolpyruvoylglucosamine reductase n=1 Tax=Dyadobacter fanqingshengii TaxID=2906443 RepID=A0A9X1PGT2_9BACT|nr:UDP-N-acetylmuramate dehydrogenase [Dyadobacter fanqingshengii]MCF0043618.1 UDP-N-acetylmuramate dehydrogenase [Dyadobacter fanqingshengii]USJ34766.1 UDP-N-acetylmuramate dehydrogenase [Dyadobacter fanqingshengii]
MQIQSNFSLRNFNTFGLESTASFFAEVRSVEELTEILRDPVWKQTPKFILGGGSNVLFTQNVNALVIHPAMKGVDKIKEDEDHIWLKVGAGESWHGFVMHCVEHNYGGVENLSLIPGTVGAAPMQNIGAYGVEIKDVVEAVETVSIDEGQKRIFSNKECEFGYRESIFKKALKNQFVVTGVTFVLNKKPVINVGYGDVQKTLAEMNVSNPTIADVSQAIITIRRSKLPDPAQIGNAGSFFKNPEIASDQYNNLKKLYPEMPGYTVSETMVKVPAGWLIEQAGWKGYRQGSIGVHQKQALVLVNYGGGNGNEIRELAGTIQDSVETKYGIRLSPEVNFI